MNHYSWMYKKPKDLVRSVKWRVLSRKSDWQTVFVYSAPRSGTTLLQLLLGSHSRAGHVAGEAGLHYPTQNIFDRSRFARYMDAETLDYVYRQSIDFVDFFENFYAATNDLKSPFFVTEKIPPHSYTYPYANWKFPRARFIAVVRDGRDAFCSAREHMGVINSTGTSVEDFARIWRIWTDRTLRLAPKKNCYFLRYEDLVAAPEQTLKDIMNFIGFEFEPGQLDPAKRAGDRRSALKEFQKLSRPIDTGSVGQFRTKLSSNEILRFEAQAGSCLSAAGYALVG